MKIVLAVATLLAATAFGQPLASHYDPVPGELSLESTLYYETNAARSRLGFSHLILEPGLTAAARQHAFEMATLDYFSHTSPVTEHQTVRHRLVKTGSPLVTVGENLALLQGQPDLAKAAIRGWLDSPGHRQNLLNPTFTHVGFGTAVNARGETLVVQVLGYKPGRLLGVEMESSAVTSTTVTVQVRANTTASSLLTIAGSPAAARTLEPGLHDLDLVLIDPQSDRYHIRLGAALPGQSGFVLQDAAWLDLASGSWSRDTTGAREQLEIAGMRLVWSEENATRIRMEYELTPEDALAVFLADEQLHGVVGPEGDVELLLPPAAVGLPIQIGLVEGNQVAIYHAFELVSDGGRLRLQPASP